MTTPERGKLIPVKGNNDSPENDKAIDVQFNPTTLKVSLSNTLKENQRNGGSRAAQFVDKSSSSLTVELIFDTTYIETNDQGKGASDPTASSAGNGASSQSEGSNTNQIEQGSDVRNQTKKIAETFLKPQEGSGNKKKAPKRCLFQWGSFEFIGLIESYEETLDFFSKEGRPLRATLSLKLKEDRFQFRQRTDGVADAQSDEPPTLSPTGNADDNLGKNGEDDGSESNDGTGDTDDSADNNDNGGADGGLDGEGAENAATTNASQAANPVPGSSNGKGSSWRDNALFNGCENPRFPSGSMLALPSASLSASVNIKASASIGASVGISAGANASIGASANASFGASAGLSVNSSTGISVQSTAASAANAQLRMTPAFNFGASASLGTRIEGAFSASGTSSGNFDGQLTATGVLNGSSPMRTSFSSLSNSNSQSASMKGGKVKITAKTGVGFD
ncbi:hypothetical protein TDB9533_03145 [Thalassocella blandensis]|nr:hypothetical protein TDB9533_03145 [Thalassocella blandensis]